MKYPAILVLFSFFVFAHAAAGDKPAPENTYVKCEVSVNQKNLRAGEKGHLVFTLTPKKGIHINLQPPIDLKLEKNSAISPSGKLELTTLKVDTAEYLDASKPVRQSFTIAKSAKPGPITLKGTLTYFYCSDVEAWCSRFKQPVNITLTVVR